MLKILARFITVMVIITFAYLFYVNTKFTSLQQLTDKTIIAAKFQNLPEIILPSKETNVGYQYELLKGYSENINIKEIRLRDINYDIEIYYSSDLCKKCVEVNKEDFLLVSNTLDNKTNNIEYLDTFKRIALSSEIKELYKINYTNEDIDDHIYNLSNGLISYTILTRSSYLFYKKYYPNLIIVKKIDSVRLVWELPKDDGSILKSVFSYLESVNGNDLVNRLANKYYSTDTMSSYIFIGSRLFISDMVTKLPEYEKLFKEIANKYSLDWKLLAALSYQESKWNNNAVSPTGVRGLMMLTENTAKMLNVNRLDIDQSIDGGARYIKILKDRFRDYNNEARLNLALAAYNVGPGHIEDIIKLADIENVNLNNWSNLKVYLFRLNKKEFYSKMKYGYARGWEAVQYVENVKQYYDILSFLEDKEEIRKDIFNEVPKTL